LSAFFDSRIDNFCSIIYNKNLVSTEIYESEHPTAPLGPGGVKTQYEDRGDFERKALNQHGPSKEKFKKTDRISTTDIKSLAHARCQSQLKLLAKELDADFRAEALLEQ